MGSLIKALTPNGENEEFFCKEHSTLTLMKLINTYNVMGFKSIELNHYQKGDKDILYLFKVHEIPKEKGIEAIKYVQEIDFSKYGKVSRTIEEKKEIIRSLGRKYLIKDVKTISPTFIQEGKGPTNNEKTETENYFEIRRTRPDKERENILGNIKTFSTLLLKKGLDDLELERLILSG